MTKPSKPKKAEKLRNLGVYIIALLHFEDLIVKWRKVSSFQGDIKQMIKSPSKETDTRRRKENMDRNSQKMNQKNLKISEITLLKNMIGLYSKLSNFYRVIWILNAPNMPFGRKSPFSREIAHPKLQRFDLKSKNQPKTSLEFCTLDPRKGLLFVPKFCYKKRIRRLLYSNAFREVSWHVRVVAFLKSNIVR